MEGLDAIIHYLSSLTDGLSNLESNLSQLQRSQALAISSHLQLRLQPLTALSLYACADNYSEATRPCLANILSFPESWILPHRLHKQALKSCAHLGIDSKYLNLLANERDKDKSAGVADAGPMIGDDASASTKPDEKTNPIIVTKLMLQRKVDALVYAALAPFVSALELTKSESNGEAPESRWLFASASPTIADLIALGLLSQALLPYSSTSSTSNIKDPLLAIPFLSTSIERQFPELVTSYLVTGLEDAFAGRVSYQKALFLAPLTAATTEESGDDDGSAFDDAIQGYDNLDVGSGKVDIPWRRKRKDDGWEGVQRAGNAFATVFGEAIGVL